MLIVLAVGSGVVPYFTDGRHPGRWSVGAHRLLGLEGPVEATALRRVLDGCHPATGRYLPHRRPHRRRAGWDLVFGAPKSVSLLAACSSPDGAAAVAGAHTDAVAGVTAYLESRLALHRSDGAGRHLPAEGLVAAAFDHTANAAAEPHLHTHLLVANLSRSGDAWGPVRGGDWFVDRPALAALYQLELRHQLEVRGWDLEWRRREDGLADLAHVPRAAVRAASTQGRLAGLSGRYAARQAAVAQTWAARVAEAAAAPIADLGLPAAGPPRPAPAGRAALDDPELERGVAIRLAGRRSDFRAADVIVALASCHPGGASAPEAVAWADRFCDRSRPVRSPTAGPRWSTDGARRHDRELVSILRQREAPPVPAPEPVGGADGRVGRLVRSLTASPAGVHVLGAPAGRTELLAQAEVLLACRRAWEAAGRRVAVSCSSAEGARRWEVLTGLTPYRPGAHVDVLVVDQADRRPSPELARLARGTDARLVLVEGGTMPRLTNPASHGLVELASEIGRVVCPPHRAWGPAAGYDGETTGGEEVGRAAASLILARWCIDSEDALMVGLGLEEVRELNRAARAARLDAGADGLLTGDRVVALGRRPGLPPYGTFGTVRATPPVTIAWADGSRTETTERRVLAAVGYGYAVTPGVAARTTAPLMVLGPSASLGRGRDRAVAEIAPRRTGPGLDLDRRPGLELGP